MEYYINSSKEEILLHIESVKLFRYNLKHKPKESTICLIITIILLGFSIQNLLAHNWLTGITQLLIALGFLLLLINNIRKTHAMKSGSCYKGCSVTNWVGNLFKKKED